MKLGLVFTLLLVAVSGCSKPSPEEQKKNEEKLAAALASAMTAAPSATVTVTGANAPAGAGGIAATCNNPSDGKCKEYKGAMGLATEDSCKSLGGVYKKEATPCSQENLLGTCVQVDSSLGTNDVDYFYKAEGITADAMKSLCEGVMSGKWVAAPKAAAPAAKAAKPAAKTKK